MSRIAQKFASLKQQGRKALIPFITAGDPTPDMTVELMHTLVRAGADIVELGVPFSDPMAEGPVIQRASERALKHGVSLKSVVAMVKEFRQDDRDTPVILMGYLNPIEVMGYARFAAMAADAGVDGTITVDLPPEEGAEWLKVLYGYDIAPVFLLAPTSSIQRIQLIASQTRGFIYYVALRGVTGAQHLDIREVEARLALIRGYTVLPIGVGFGISTAESAAAVAKLADAVVVGSAIVKKIEQLQAQPDKIHPALASFIGEIRASMDNLGFGTAPVSKVQQ